MKEVARPVRARGQVRQGRLQLVISRRSCRVDKQTRLLHPVIFWLSVILAIALAVTLAATALAVGLTLLALTWALTVTIGLVATISTLIARRRRRPRIRLTSCPRTEHDVRET